MNHRFPSGPAYDRDSKYPPAFPCASQDCDYAGWTLDELHECIVCKKRFCKDCLREIGGEKICPGCAKCACGEPALIACDECSSLVCERHMAIDPVRNECRACAKKAEMAAFCNAVDAKTRRTA